MSRNSAKGSKAERDVRDYLRANGYPHAERRHSTGRHDTGDITGVDPGVVIEVKDHARLDLAAWLEEAELERLTAGANIGVAWHKRRGHSSPAGWYVTMTGATFVELLRHYTGSDRCEPTP